MSTPALQLLPADIADRLGALEVFSRFRVEGFQHSLNRSPSKGFSSDFLQHRHYFQGDNLKFLNWRLYAKSERLFIREFEEETNTRISLLLDISSSMSHKGDNSFTKLEFGVRLAAILSRLASLQRDSFSLTTFNTSSDAHVPFGSGPAHFQRVLMALAAAAPNGATDFVKALTIATAPIRYKGLTIVISDFMDDPQRIVPLLARLRFRGSDLIAMQVFDPSERSMELTNVIRFHDLEGPEVITVDPTLIQREYHRAFDAHQEEMRTACHRSGFDHIVLPVSDDFETALSAYLRRRNAIST